MKIKKLVLLGVVCVSIGISAQEEFKPSGKVVGEVFGDFYYKMNGDTGKLLTGSGEYQKTENKSNAFALRRIYLGYQYELSESFSVKILLDGSDGDLLENGKRGVNVKNAYVSWNNIFPGSKLIIGSQTTPIFADFIDKVWGYRSIEKHIVDFRKLGSSSDLGISLSGELLKDEVLSYFVMVGNGRAQKPEDNNYKRIYTSLTSKLMDKKLLVNGYFDFEPNTDSSSVTMLKGFVGYQTDMFTVGFDNFINMTLNDGGITQSKYGASLFARGVVIEKTLNAFFRIDLFNPDIDESNLGYTENFSTIGLDYTPIKNMSFMPNIWFNGYNAKSSGTVDRKSDVVGRLTFRYKF